MHTPYEAPLTEDEVGALARAGVPFVTTLRCFSGDLDLASAGPTRFEREFLGEARLEAFKHPPARVPEMVARESVRFVEYGQNQAANALALRAAGVPFLVGTDGGVPGVYPGAGLHHEIEALVGLGIPAEEVLAAATSRAAAFLDPSGSFGRVAPGQRADLLLVRGDPTTDITALGDIEAVWLEGARIARHGTGEFPLPRVPRLPEP
jgi:imidazolonepropionase-like amidohydrolase